MSTSVISYNIIKPFYNQKTAYSYKLCNQHNMDSMGDWVLTLPLDLGTETEFMLISCQYLSQFTSHIIAICTENAQCAYI